MNRSNNSLFTYVGDTLTFLADAEFDFSALQPYEKPGFAFLGFRDKNGAYAPKTVSVRAGDLFTADYLPIRASDANGSSDFAITALHAAFDDDRTTLHLSVDCTASKSFLSALDAAENAEELCGRIGVLTLPTALTRGHDMKIDPIARVGAPMYNECVEALPVGDGTEHWPYASMFGGTNWQTKEYLPKVDPTTWSSPDGSWNSESGATVLFADRLSDTPSGDALSFTVTFAKIAKESYAEFFTVKPFLLYTDKQGVPRAAYATYHTTSPLREAKAVLADKALDKETRALFDRLVSYVTVERKAAYFAENYGDHGEKTVSLRTENLANGPYTWETNESGERLPGIVGKDFYRLANGLIVREVEYDLFGGKYGKIEIVQAGDTHLNYLNDRDLYEQDPCVFASYKGREWNRNGSSVPCINAFMEYAGFFDMTVITGDLLDFFSWGCAEMTEKLIVDRSEEGKLLMAIGNHEPSIHMIPIDHTCGHTDASIDAIHARLSQFWVNDTKYASKILKSADGHEMVILAALDDQAHEFTWQEIYDGLNKDISYARAHGLKIFLTAHCPMSTRGGREVDNCPYFYHSDKCMSDPAWTIDLGKREAGSTGHTLDTKIHRLITDNADVIRGVFVGDYHSFMYTEIEGTDANKTKIPQYVASANAFGPRVTKITVR